MGSTYHWNWLIFWQVSDDQRFYWEWLLEGAITTAKIAVLAFALACVLGSILGVCRTLGTATTQPSTWIDRCLNRLASVYVEIFRNIPLIVQLFIWYHILPEVLPNTWGDYLKQSLAPWVTGFIGLGLFTASRIAEQIKAALLIQSKGQTLAAFSLGLKNWQNYCYIRLPIAYRHAMPTLTSEAMNVFKNSSVTFAVGVLETFFQGKQIIEKTAQEYEILIAIAGIYMLFALMAYLICTQIARKLALPGMIGH